MKRPSDQMMSYQAGISGFWRPSSAAYGRRCVQHPDLLGLSRPHQRGERMKSVAMRDEGERLGEARYRCT